MTIGLGTNLRLLLAAFDGDVQSVYDDLGVLFRPRFYPVMQMLLDREACTVGEIADATGVTQPAATQTVNEMKRLGLVATSLTMDRRLRPARLTKAGKQLANRLSPVWTATAQAAAALEAELLHGLSGPIEDALAALERRDFRTRIHSQMEKE